MVRSLFLACALASAAFPGAALAQQAAPPAAVTEAGPDDAAQQPPGNPPAADAVPVPSVAKDAALPDPAKVVRQQAANELRLDWITRATVAAPDGEIIGKVSDLILDRDSGRMVAAVIGVGGFLGIGEKPIAVPWDRLVIDTDASRITSDLTRAEAEAAPEYVFRPQADAAPPQ